MALVFTVAGFIGLVVTLVAFNSRYYRALSAAYAKVPDDGAAQARPA
jgi:DHA3 family multidrug efflux protein-like MFS transporter